MKLIVSAKNMEMTDALKNVVEKKLSKLEKYFEPNIEARATLSVERNRQTIEVTIPFNGVVLRGEEVNDDMYASIDLVVDKIERQIRKQKTKLLRRNHTDSLRFHSIDELIEDKNKEGKPIQDDDAEPEIVRSKRHAFKPMSPEEAVLQMEMLGHDFFIYQNAESEEVNVVYKRKDGNYGLIEPEF